MLQKIKKIIPWVLVIILFGLLIWTKKKLISSSSDIKSTIETKVSTEESLIDSFSVVREIIQIKRDSSLYSIDTMRTQSLLQLLRNNISWYETDSTINYTSNFNHNTE